MVQLRAFAALLFLPQLSLINADTNNYQKYISQYAGDYLKQFGSKDSGYDDSIHD